MWRLTCSKKFRPPLSFRPQWRLLSIVSQSFAGLRINLLFPVPIRGFKLYLSECQQPLPIEHLRECRITRGERHYRTTIALPPVSHLPGGDTERGTDFLSAYPHLDT